MFELNYERIGHVVSLATLDPNSACANMLQLHDGALKDKDIEIKFSNYVKSQLHYFLDIGTEKSFFTYVNAYKYLSGEQQFKEDAFHLLRCFYNDIATFLLHSSVELNVIIEVDIDADIWSADLNQIKQSISLLFDKSNVVSPEEFKGILKESKYAWIFDFVGDVETGKKLISNYALAAALIDMLQEEKVYKFVEV